MVRCCIILQLLYNKSQLIVLRSRSRSCSCSCSWGITALKYATKLCSKRKINSRSLARSQHRAVQRTEQCSTMPLAIGKRSLQPNRKSQQQQQQQRCQLKRKCKAFLCISSKQQNEQLNNNNNTYNNTQKKKQRETSQNSPRVSFGELFLLLPLPFCLLLLLQRNFSYAN